ncbi:hypothetical protein BH20ACI4_BH20ACI4_04730 [soil metagenome]
MESLTNHTIKNFGYAVLISVTISFLFALIFLLMRIILSMLNNEFNYGIPTILILFKQLIYICLIFVTPLPFIISFALFQRFNLKR